MKPLHPAATLLGLGSVLGGGTLASVLVCVVWLLLPAPLRPWFCGLCLVSGAVATRVGVAAAGGSDDRRIVSDEVAGAGLVALAAWRSPAALGVGIVLFRLLDIFKPGPVGALERMPGWVGVLADDLAAGAGAGLVALAVNLWLVGGG